MKESGQQFNMASPDVPKKPDDEKEKKADGEKEKKEASKNPYFEERESSCVYLGVEVPKGKGGDLVPNKEAFRDYFYTEEDYVLMREIATALKLKQPYLMESGTGIGKTSAVKKMCADLNLNYGLVSFHEESDLVDIIGHKDIIIDEDGKEEVKWFDGRATKIIRGGGVLFIDEYNFQGGKVGGRLAPIIDSILNGDKKITLPENDNEMVDVHPNLYLIAAQNPPGTEEGEEFTGRDVLSAEKFGRWNFQKFPIRMSKEMEKKRMLGMAGEEVEIEISAEEFRYAGEGIPLSELKNIPGMKHWIGKYVEIRELLETKTRDRSMGRQAQKIYFNPRLGQKILRYVSQFYRGDVNEVWKNAVEYFIVKMFKSKEDQEKVRALIEQSLYIPPKKGTKRKGPDRGKKKSPEELKKEKTLAEIEKIKRRIGETVSPESLPGELTEQIEKAKEIMDAGISEEEKEKGVTEVLGPAEIEKALDLKLDSKEIPKIPFPEKELKRAQELNQYLILRIKETPDGKPLTMQKMNEMKGKEFVKEGKGKLLYSDDDEGELKDDAWYKDEDLFTKDTPQLEWVLVSRETIPDSTSQNYLQQTETIIDYLKNKVFKDKELPEIYREAITEFESQKDEIAELIKSDWEKAAEKLENLKITHITRQSPVEALYDMLVYFQINDKKLLENEYTWTKRRHSYGRLVDFGASVALGASVSSSRPGLSPYDMGVSFSRS